VGSLQCSWQGVLQQQQQQQQQQAYWLSSLTLHGHTQYIHQVGDILQDKRRVNVALTRAKHKIIMIGSRRTLVHNELFANYLQLLSSNNWVWVQ
jgi:nitrate reductase NapAB chaperone NapD